MSNEGELERKPDGSADPPLVEVESVERKGASGGVNSEERSDEPKEVLGGGVDGSNGSTGKSGPEEARVCAEELVAETRVSDDMELNRENDDSVVAFVQSQREVSEDVRNSSEEARISEVKVEGEDVFRSDVFSVRDIELVERVAGPDEGTRFFSGRTDGDAEIINEPTFSDFGVAYSTVEEGHSSRLSEAAFGSEAAKALSYGFEPGDMVWGKVKSHPWWPGHIFNEAFASHSVRRTKREGHVLVAFFGDSSYGWFDLAELISFEPHYSEKSRQTNSRNFMKAVEEAVDEACRRQALGLTCRCRNRFNFRPTHIQGYFSVDVPGYEPGAVYSVKRIKQARDSFQPAKVLSFVQQLATMPRNYEQRSIDWINYRATVLAYRKAVFEEFDETYAQAFGVQPVRPSLESMGALDQLAKGPSRAPLSGPLVVAEALGERKTSGRLTKVKELTRKDKYLFKRRDESLEPRAFHGTQDHTDFAVPSAHRELTTAITPGDYVFQKRTPAIMPKPVYAPKQEGPGIFSTGGAILAGDVPGQESESVERTSVAATDQVNMSSIDSSAGLGVSYPAHQPVAYGRTAIQGGMEDGKLYQAMGSSIHEIDERMKSDVTLRVTATGQDGSNMLEAHGFMGNLDHNLAQDGRGVVDLKLKENVNLCSNFEVLEQYEHTLSMPVESQSGLYQVLDGGHSTTVTESVGAPALLVDAKLSGSVGTNMDRVVKKKVPKRPAEDLRSDKSNMGEIKKKKRKELGLATSLEHPQGHLKALKDGELPKKSARKSTGIGLVPRENSQVDQQGKENGASGTFISDSAVPQPLVDLGNIVVEFPQLVSDLLGLALDPFHGIERNGPAIVRHVLLRFRSLVYQKSLVLAPLGEVETPDLSAGKSSASTEPSEIPSVGDVKTLSSKQRKHFMRPDDPTKAGRKRSLSDRQEEMSVKRLKKLNELKAMATEKRSGNQKMQEVQREQKDALEQKDAGTTAVGKLMKKPSLVKKQELPARLSEPAMLVMKFPPRTTLPSIPELKAKFGRFGPLDHSAMRVFWKSSTCRVVFKHKDHAQAAHNYAVQNKALFGHVKVSYYLRDVEIQAPEVAEPARPDELVQFRPGGGNDAVGEAGTVAGVRRPQPTIQLKSCLKKPSGEEAAGGIAKESPRVKFMLSGEESSRAEQLMVSSSRDVLNKDDGGGASSSLAMDVNSKNFQKVIPQVPVLLPNVVPRAPRIQEMHETRGLAHFTKSSHHAPPISEVEPINNNNYKMAATTSSNNKNNTTIDISHQMLSLLVRCNDIVMDVKCSLGYVPYHPL